MDTVTSIHVLFFGASLGQYFCLSPLRPYFRRSLFFFVCWWFNMLDTSRVAVMFGVRWRSVTYFFISRKKLLLIIGEKRKRKIPIGVTIRGDVDRTNRLHCSDRNTCNQINRFADKKIIAKINRFPFSSTKTFRNVFSSRAVYLSTQIRGRNV